MGRLPGIMMYFDFRPAIDKLSFEQLGRLFAAMLNYGEFGEVPEFTDPEMSMAWGFVARYVDNDRKRYEAKCERARARAMKRWEQDEEAPEEADEDASYTDAKTKTKSKTKTKQNHNQKQKQTPAIPESVENPVESYSPRSPEEFEALRQKALDRLARGMSFKSFYPYFSARYVPSRSPSRAAVFSRLRSPARKAPASSLMMSSISAS